MNHRKALIAIVLVGSTVLVGASTMPLWASEGTSTTVEESDVEIEERTRALTNEIVAAMNESDNTDWEVVWPLVVERSDVCSDLLVEPEAEHSQYVQDQCGSQIEDALSSKE